MWMRLSELLWIPSSCPFRKAIAFDFIKVFYLKKLKIIEVYAFKKCLLRKDLFLLSVRFFFFFLFWKTEKYLIPVSIKTRWGKAQKKVLVAGCFLWVNQSVIPYWKLMTSVSFMAASAKYCLLLCSKQSFCAASGRNNEIVKHTEHLQWPWFQHVCQISNSALSAMYLDSVLLREFFYFSGSKKINEGHSNND